MASIDESVLQELVENKVSEGREIEYKSRLPGKTESEKKELLADVSSFANALGGDIVYGVDEERDAEGGPTGIPSELVGLEVDNAEVERLRLQSTIRDGIEPRLEGFEIADVPLTGRKIALIIRIPRSLDAPHAVTYKGSFRFHVRSGERKVQMDVHELRKAFTSSFSARELVKRERLDRINQIVSGETPVPLGTGPKVAVHVVPMDRDVVLDLHKLATDRDAYSPLGSPSRGSGYRFNFDGLMGYNLPGPTTSYVQFWRSGMVEAVTSDYVKVDGSDKYLNATKLEQDLAGWLPARLQWLHRLGVHLPVAVGITLLGVRGASIPLTTNYSADLSTGIAAGIDRDLLAVDAFWLEEWVDDVYDILHASLEAIWQAAGWPRSRFFRRDGEWIVDQTWPRSP